MCLRALRACDDVRVTPGHDCQRGSPHPRYHLAAAAVTAASSVSGKKMGTSDGDTPRMRMQKEMSKMLRVLPSTFTARCNPAWNGTVVTDTQTSLRCEEEEEKAISLTAATV